MEVVIDRDLLGKCVGDALLEEDVTDEFGGIKIELGAEMVKDCVPEGRFFALLAE